MIHQYMDYFKNDVDIIYADIWRKYELTINADLSTVPRLQIELDGKRSMNLL